MMLFQLTKSKATVLAKATEYIAHLENRNRSLEKENAVLKSRVEAFEILMRSRQATGQRPVPALKNSGGRQLSGIFDGMLKKELC